jgi:sec-independent protein translocase protein TatA
MHTGFNADLTFPLNSSNFSKSSQYRQDLDPQEEALMFLLGPVGPMELLVIVLIVIVIFGARRLPELGKSLGEGIKNFRKSISGKEKNTEPPPDKPQPPAKEE